MKADLVSGLHRVRRAEYGRDDWNDVHQRHADHAKHVRPIVADSLDDRRLRNLLVLTFFGEGRRLIDLAADDVARDDDDDAEQEGNTPPPAHERLGRHVVRERQKHRRGEDLPGLHALQRKACEECSPAERSVLQDHGACPGNLTGDRKALDQPQDDQQQRRQPADLLIRRQNSDSHGRETHEEHADEEHGLAAVGVAPVTQKECTNRTSDVADTVGRQRGDDGDRRVPFGEEDLRENQRRCGRIDKEIVVLQRGANPPAGGGLPGLVCTVRLMFHGAGRSSH